jgi:hypothetical protein
LFRPSADPVQSPRGLPWLLSSVSGIFLLFACGAQVLFSFSWNMTSLIQDSSFHPEFKQLLSELCARVTAGLVCETTPISLRMGVRETVEQALVDLARAGQRHPAQLEQYASSRGRAFLVSQLSS